MPTEIACAITKDSTETNFKFMIKSATTEPEIIKITIPISLNNEECANVIRCFVDSLTTSGSTQSPPSPSGATQSPSLSGATCEVGSV